MRKSKNFLALTVCVCGILFTACGNENATKMDGTEMSTVGELSTTIVESVTTTGIQVTENDNTELESTTVPESTTEVETTTVPETTTVEETTTVPETTTVEETTTKAPTPVSDLESIINSQALNPFRNDFTPAYEEIDKVFASIFTDGMTTYDKVKACYDYLINNCSYGNNEVMMDYIDYYFYGYSYEVRTYGMLKGKIGVCDDYSATFATMMQALGLNCYLVGGQTAKSGGGYTGHAWCEMNLNGTIYVFDPQVEDNIAKGGAIKYYRFGKTYEQVPGKYIKEE